MAEIREMASKKVSEDSCGVFMLVCEESDFVCVWLSNEDRDER